MRSLERSIAFCQSTLSYGRAQGGRARPPADPDRAVVVSPGIGGPCLDASIAWISAMSAGFPSTPIPIRCFGCCSICAQRGAGARKSAPQRRGGVADSHYRPREARASWRSPIPVPACPPGPASIFSRHSRPLAAPAAGGLGLAIAAELVRAHGGDIHLVEGNIGATFRIVIPDRPVELLSVAQRRARA